MGKYYVFARTVPAANIPMHLITKNRNVREWEVPRGEKLKNMKFTGLPSRIDHEGRLQDIGKVIYEVDKPDGSREAMIELDDTSFGAKVMIDEIKSGHTRGVSPAYDASYFLCENNTQVDTHMKPTEISITSLPVFDGEKGCWILEHFSESDLFSKILPQIHNKLGFDTRKTDSSFSENKLESLPLEAMSAPQSMETVPTPQPAPTSVPSTEQQQQQTGPPPTPQATLEKMSTLALTTPEALSKLTPEQYMAAMTLFAQERQEMQQKMAQLQGGGQQQQAQGGQQQQQQAQPISMPKNESEVQPWMQNMFMQQLNKLRNDVIGSLDTIKYPDNQRNQYINMFDETSKMAQSNMADPMIRSNFDHLQREAATLAYSASRIQEAQNQNFRAGYDNTQKTANQVADIQAGLSGVFTGQKVMQQQQKPSLANAQNENSLSTAIWGLAADKLGGKALPAARGMTQFYYNEGASNQSGFDQQSGQSGQAKKMPTTVPDPFPQNRGYTY